MRKEDIDAVATLAAGEPTAPHWPVSEYRRMIRVTAESPARRGAWVLLLDQPVAPGNPLRDARTSTDLKEGPLAPALIGFAMASHVAGICDLEAVVVESPWRGRRFGELLVQAVAAWGEELGATCVELEVRASNLAALRLYRRIGFISEGLRPGYYTNPEEDAMLMSLLLPPQAGPR